MNQRGFFLALFLAAAVCGAMLYFQYLELESQAVEALYVQEQTLANQASQGVRDYFLSQRRVLDVLSLNPHVINLDIEGKSYLRSLLGEGSKDILALTRSDSQGIIVYSTPDDSVAGRDISNQAHVKLMLEKPQCTVSDVFTTVQGFRGVALSVPVFDSGSFSGSLSMVLAFDVIARRYLEGVSIAETGYAFVISAAGIELFAPERRRQGSSIFENLADYPEVMDLARSMVAGESGRAKYKYDRIYERVVEPQLKHAVFMPIPLENTFWSICVTTPESEVTKSIQQARYYQVSLGLAVLALMGLGVYKGFGELVLSREVARRRETEKALRESESLYRSVIENITDVFYRTNAEGMLSMVSPSGVRLLGFASAEEMLGQPNENFWMWPRQRQALLEALTKFGEVRDYEVVLKNKQGQPLHVSTSSRLMRDEDGNVLGVEGTFRDMSERKRMEEQLVFRALHDPLTGLANRTLCLDRIAQANERGLRKPEYKFAVVFIDLDRFKEVNDSLGHAAGDSLLCEVGERLSSCARRMDTVCRYGGDEFVFVLDDTGLADTIVIIKRVREALKTCRSIGSHSIQVEASYGVAHGPQKDMRPEDLLRNANIALHQAKHGGRNRIVVFRPSMHDKALARLSLQSDMTRGLESGDFFLVYQPIFEMESGALHGFEALMRFKHPVRGIIMPGEFIPVAEDTGFIGELGFFALSSACEDMARLEELGLLCEGMTVSVNLSPRQLSKPGIADQVRHVLLRSGLKPSRLVLEITESSIIKHPEASHQILSKLKEQGIGIAIDDFGTGYSSMSALKKLPLDRLKIDMSFVRKLTASHEDRQIVRAVMNLAHGLNLKTVAEGVETREQLEILREMGCDMGQGYLCSRPKSLADLTEMLHSKVCLSEI